MPAQRSRKKLTRIQKILQDFPWLWGIHRFWSSEDSVCIKRATVDFLKRKLPTAFGSHLCIKKKGSYQSEALEIHIVADFITLPNSIGKLMSSSAKNETIEYVGIYALDGIRNSRITIYRPPKGTTFNEMLAAGVF